MAWVNWQFCLYFLLCALVHEFGHLVVMKCCGIPIGRVAVGLSGAVIETQFPSYKMEFICALGGPLAGVVLSLSLMEFLPECALISFLLSAVNLLPIASLDGGRMLRAVLYSSFTPMTAQKIVKLVSAVVCCALMVLVCWAVVVWQMGLWPIFAALILLCRISDAE